MSLPHVTADPSTSLQRLLDEEPFVRLLARTLVAEEADEVVQQTWLQAVQHGGDGVASPRSWLARIARNVATNLRRGGQRRRRHEDAAGAPPPVPSSAELMLREEQRRALVHAVDALPPPLRTVVLLRFFDGLPPRRIAKRLGLPVATVWNQLRRALHLLRERLDAGHGGERRAWLVPLVPFAAGTRGAAAPATAAGALGIGVIAMTMKTKLVATAGVLLAATVLAWWCLHDGEPGRAPDTHPRRDRPEVASASLPTATPDTSPAPSVAREAALAATAGPAATTGSLVVHVRWGKDKSPLAGVPVIVAPFATDMRVDGLRAMTDATGTARFETLPPESRLWVQTIRSFARTNVEVRAGETEEIDLELPIGLLMTGVVVDAANAPVAGALIEVVPMSWAHSDAEVAATCDADGRFTVRSASGLILIGARAEGHAASPLRVIQGKEGAQADVRLQLGPPAGSVDGLVVDERGGPIAGAVVRIGEGNVSDIKATIEGAPPLPAQVRSDAAGRFRAIGIATGLQPVVARAPGRAAWSGTVEVAANLATPLRIRLEPGAALRGVVRNADGVPVDHAKVEIGDARALDHFRATTASNGAFEIVGLGTGEIVVAASHDDFGTAEQRVRTAAGTVTACEVRLSAKALLNGRVEDEQGAPIAKAQLRCSAEGGFTGGFQTDAEGRFVVRNCPEDTLLTVTVQAKGFDELQRAGVVPGGEPLVLRLRRSPPPTARITGIVAGPDGKPIANAMVGIYSNVMTRVDGNTSGPDGRFDSGLVSPGTWQVCVMTSEHPQFESEARVLGANDVWDLGTIRLSAGGRATVAVDGDRTGMQLRIVDGAAKTWAVFTEVDGVLLSAPLAAGEHRLLVHGKNVAAQSIPFTVRAGETTKVAVKPAPGVRQRVELTTNALDPPPRFFDVRLHRGDELLFLSSFRPDAATRTTVDLCLPPGAFTLTATTDERELARTTFTVGATEGAPLRLALR